MVDAATRLANIRRGFLLGTIRTKGVTLKDPREERELRKIERRRTEAEAAKQAAARARKTQLSARTEQRSIAKRELNTIVGVSESKDSVTFIGRKGKAITFRLGSIDFARGKEPLPDPNKPPPPPPEPIMSEARQSFETKDVLARLKEPEKIQSLEKPEVLQSVRKQQSLEKPEVIERIKSKQTFRQKVDTSLETEGFGEFFVREGVNIRRDEPFPTRLKKTAANVAVLTGRGFGSTFKFAKERPVAFGATIIGFSLGVGLIGRSITAVTGIGLARAKAITSVGVLGGFGAVKEFKEPGSVTTLPGAIGTTTEFGAFALGAKGVGAAAKSTRILVDPRFIPFVRTTAEKPPPAIAESEIPIFEGTTRTGPAALQTQGVGESATIFSTTATTPKGFFGRFSGLRAKLGLEPKFEVVEPAKGEVGGERAKFGEKFFFFSKGEAFTVFGEDAAARLGASSRPPGKAAGGPLKRLGLQLVKGVTEFPQRVKDVTSRRDTPIILRATEKISGFSKAAATKIKSSQFGSKLRAKLAGEVTAKPGKVFPGTRTTGIGRGEIEFVSAPGTKIFRLAGPKRVTFSPTSGRFVEVVDVGFSPGKANVGRFNLGGRVRNVGDIIKTEVFGLKGTSTKRAPLPKDFTPIRTPPFRGATIPARPTAPARPSRTFPRAREFVPRARAIEPKTRERTRDRPPRIRPPRVRPPRVRPPRERPRPEPRPRLRDRDRTRDRDFFRDRGKERDRDRTRDRKRTRDDTTIRLFNKDKIRDITLIESKKKKKKSKRVFQPTLKASGLKIFGPRPKVLTGLGIRPVPIGSKPLRFF